MLDQFLNLPVPVGLTVFVLAIIALGLIPYLLAHSLLPAHISDETKSVAESVFRISGALLGLLLSLTFADIRSEVTRVKDSVELEAAQIVDIYNDLARYDSEEATALQQKLIDFTKTILDEEWVKLDESRNSSKAWDIFGKLQIGILELKPENERQKVLVSRLLQDIDEISDYRQERFYHAKKDPPIYIFIALFGFMITMALFCVHPPKLASMLFMSMFSTFVAVVMYFSLAMSQPFEGPMSVSPRPFEVIYQDFTTNSEKAMR